MADIARMGVEVYGKDNLSQELKRIESGVIRFVGAISSAATAIAAVGFPIIQAAQFQKELLNAAKTTEYTRDELGLLKDGLKSLSSQISVTAVDLAKIATMGGQIGLGKNDPAALVEFTKTVATAVVALDLSAEEVVASFGKLINIFNIKPDQFRNAMSALNEVSNASNATADQLFDVVRRIGNVGGSLNLPQAAALSATMIDLGLTAETAGTTITKIFADFKSNAAEFAAVVKNDAIKSTEDWVNLVAKDGVAALNAYVDALNKLAPQEAARLQGRLTGEGRLFEAINKLREQRSRELSILDEATKAEEELTAIQQGRVKANEQEIKGLEDRKKALFDAATQANVLARLQQSAKDAFRAGDSAEKEQRTMLGSLTAQWTIFLNNINNLATAAGEVFLPPLTAALQKMSEALRDPVNADSLKRAAQDILDAIGSIIDVVKELSSVFKGLKSADFDWGALLRATALVAAMAAFKGLISLMRTVGATFANAIPGVMALNTALFGTVEKSNSASSGLDKTGASAERTGGLFNKAANAIRAGIEASAVASERFAATQAAIEARLTAVSAAAANVKVQMDAVFSNNRMAPFRVQTTELARYHALLKAVTTAEKANADAIAAGRPIRGTSSNLTYLRNQLDLYEQLRAKMLQAQRIQAELTQRQIRAELTLNEAGVLGQANRVVARLRQAGERAGIEFSYAFSAGAQRGVTGLVVDAVGGMAKVATAAVSYGRLAGAGFANGFKAAGANALTSIELVVGKLGSVGPAATAATTRVVALGAALRNLSVPDIANQLKSVTQSAAGTANRAGGGMFSVAAAAAAAAAAALAEGAGVGFDLLKKKIGEGVLSLTGYTKAWQAASTTAAKGIVGLGVAFSLLGKAISGVFRLGLSFINVFFLGSLIIDVLKAIGVWDTLAEKIQNVIRLLGFEPPSFLKTDAQNREFAERLGEIEKAYEGAFKEAARFNKEAAATALIAQDRDALAKRVTFTPVEPLKADQNTLATFRAILAGYSQLNKLEAERFALNQRMEASVDRLTTTQREYLAAVSSKAPPLEVARLRDAYEEAKLAVSSLRGELDNVLERRSAIGDLGLALRNVVTQAFTAGEAQTFFGEVERGGARTVSIFQQLLREQDKLRAIEQRRVELDAKKANLRETVGSKGEDIYRLQLIAINKELSDLGDRSASAKEAVASLRKTMVEASQGGEAILGIFDSITASLDPEALRKAGEELRRIMETTPTEGFAGLRVPKIEANDILSAGVSAIVNRRIAGMYDQLAKAASTAAERAKNYATQIAGEVERAYRNLRSRLDQIDENVATKKQRAANQALEREEDRRHRERMSDIDAEKQKELDLVDQRFQGVDSLNEQYRLARREVEEYYRRVNDLEQDRLNQQRTSREIEQNLKRFDALIARTKIYQQEIEAANATAADPNVGEVERLAAIERRNLALDKLRSLMQKIDQLGDSIINTDPIGSKYIVTDEQVAKIKAGTKEVTDVFAAAALKDKDKLEQYYAGVAKAFGNEMRAFEGAADSAFGRFSQLVRQSFGAAEIEPALVALAKITASTKTLGDVFDLVKQKTDAGLINPGSVDLKGIPGAVEALQKALSAQRFTLKPNIELTGAQLVNANDLEKELLQQYKSVLSKLSTSGAGVQIGGAFSEQAITGMKDQVQSIRPEIQGTLKITNTPEVTIKGKVITEGVGPGGGGARGGLVGEAVGLASSIVGFARGGYAAVAPERLLTPLARTVASLASQIVLKPISNFAGGGATGPIRARDRIRGPGTGTSDSILSWLSNGEYVIDALTTARFGPDFFRKLQTAARGGLSLNVLREVKLPKFAEGGMLSEPILQSALAGAAATNSTVVSEHAVSLTINGKSIGRLRGSRDTVKSLVSALKEIERGVS